METEKKPRLAGVFKPLKATLAHPDPELAVNQLAETAQMLPLLVLFQLAATATVAYLAAHVFPPTSLRLFLAAGAGIGVLFAGLYFAIPRWLLTEKRALLASAVAPLVGATMSVFWLTTIHTLSSIAPDQVLNAAYVFALFALFAGLLSTLRLLASAVQFLFGAAVISLMLVMQNFAMPNLIAFGLEAVAFVAFASLVILTSVSLRRRHQLSKERKRDLDLIKLLLNDIGAEGRDWHWESDTAGNLRDASEQLAKILGKPAEELVGAPFLESFFSKHAPEIWAKLAQHEALANAVMSIELDGAPSHWLVSARPLQTATGAFHGYRGVARDVTTQREHERQISAARDVAQKALEARSQFLAVISHELRTPINAIVGFSEVLSAGHGEHLSVSARREYLGTILESAKHLQGLINEVLEATRIERGTLKLEEQPNDVAELIEVVAKIVRDQAAQGKISVVARVVDDVVLVGDLTRLKQVILNILGNAIKFSPEGGIVNVDMLRAQNGDLVITVRDAGIGISDADAERVFEPFVQVENGSTRRFGGLGLGLAIARRIARLHGGELSLKGLQGGGTEARLIMPAARVTWPKVKPKALAKTEAA